MLNFWKRLHEYCSIFEIQSQVLNVESGDFLRIRVIYIMSDFAHRKIMNNDISSPSIGIFLQGAEYNQVLNNYIRIVLQGILLGNESENNLKYAYRLKEVQ